MGVLTSQITSLTIVCSNVYSGTVQRKHQSSASLAFVRGIHRRPVNSSHKWPVTWKMFPFNDVACNMSSLNGWIRSILQQNHKWPLHVDAHACNNASYMEASTKLPPFCRYHFQMRFGERRFLYIMLQSITGICMCVLCEPINRHNTYEKTIRRWCTSIPIT